VQKYVENVKELGWYPWAEGVWRVLVESIEDIQNKLLPGGCV